MVEKHLYAYLISKPSITDLVGTKIYPQLSPAEAPVITYQRLITEREYQHSGHTGHTRCRILLTVWGGRDREGYESAKEIADAVRLAVDGFVGYWGTMRIDKCFFEDERDTVAETNNDYLEHGVEIEVAVSFRETATSYA